MLRLADQSGLPSQFRDKEFVLVGHWRQTLRLNLRFVGVGDHCLEIVDQLADSYVVLPGVK